MASKKKPLRLRVGRTYIARNGSRYKIVAKPGASDFPYQDDEGCLYRADGRWNGEGKDQEHPFDLIREVPAPRKKPARKAAKPKWQYAVDLGKGWIEVMPLGFVRKDAARYARPQGNLVRVKIEVRR